MSGSAAAAAAPVLSPRSPRHTQRLPLSLPHQNINANLMNTPVDNVRSASTLPRPPVAEWALAARSRIDRDVGDKLRPVAEDVEDLVQEVCAVFITALQKNR